jgi:hypothetical protein
MEVEAGRASGEELVEAAGKDIKARNTTERPPGRLVEDTKALTRSTAVRSTPPSVSAKVDHRFPRAALVVKCQSQGDKDGFVFSSSAGPGSALLGLRLDRHPPVVGLLLDGRQELGHPGYRRFNGGGVQHRLARGVVDVAAGGHLDQKLGRRISFSAYDTDTDPRRSVPAYHRPIVASVRHKTVAPPAG